MAGMVIDPTLEKNQQLSFSLTNIISNYILNMYPQTHREVPLSSITLQQTKATIEVTNLLKG